MPLAQTGSALTRWLAEPQGKSGQERAPQRSSGAGAACCDPSNVEVQVSWTRAGSYNQLMATSPRETVPTFEKLINPTLRALHKCGGSASITELIDAMLADLTLPGGAVELPHPGTSMTEVEYRSAWARNYLKNAGLIENSERGVWALTPEGRGQRKRTQKRSCVMCSAGNERGGRHQTMTARLSLRNRGKGRGVRRPSRSCRGFEPDVFERYLQRLLRESGFIEVEVTKRSGDGGIDGYGTIRIGGLISFNVLFQSKRYRNNIGPEVVRDFRGAMVGRADKGLIITTSGFTREARKEATRDLVRRPSTSSTGSFSPTN